MKREDVHRCWAPANERWSPWVKPVLFALVDAAERVAAAPPGATPAFLLDANRMGPGQAVTPGRFDNRSVCSPSDFPSETLWRAGIRRMLLIQQGGGRPAADLEFILLIWQARGIALWQKNADESAPAAPFVLRRRFWISRWLHIVRRAFLRRRSDNSYGELVPTPATG
jgi:hypothetical protein